MNLIKQSALRPDTPCNTRNRIELNGITITVNNNLHIYHVSDSFPIHQKGIVETDLLNKEKAVLSFFSKSLTINNNVTIPFQNEELTIPARTAKVIPVKITNTPETEVAVLGKLNFRDGIFVRESLVRSRKE